MSTAPLAPDEEAAARRVWALMDADMRAFVVALNDAGLIDGRHALANARIAILPDTLPRGDGVIPEIPTPAEREAMEALRNKGKRA